jgi:hypothetical protein
MEDNKFNEIWETVNGLLINAKDILLEKKYIIDNEQLSDFYEYLNNNEFELACDELYEIINEMKNEIVDVKYLLKRAYQEIGLNKKANSIQL